jgi:hypothetical protein
MTRILAQQGTETTVLCAPASASDPTRLESAVETLDEPQKTGCELQVGPLSSAPANTAHSTLANRGDETGSDRPRVRPDEDRRSVLPSGLGGPMRTAVEQDRQ